MPVQRVVAVFGDEAVLKVVTTGLVRREEVQTLYEAARKGSERLVLVAAVASARTHDGQEINAVQGGDEPLQYCRS